MVKKKKLWIDFTETVDLKFLQIVEHVQTSLGYHKEICINVKLRLRYPLQVLKSNFW